MHGILQARFARQEHWGGLPCTPPGDLSDSRTEPRSPTLQADSLLSEPLFLFKLQKLASFPAPYCGSEKTMSSVG